MATVTFERARIEVKAKITLELTEDEARALSGIFGYSVDAFIRVFYERMGKAYVQPYEAGVRSLHETIRGALSAPLSHIAETRARIHRAMKGETK